MNWSNIQVDHVKPICLFDVSKDEKLKEAFNWKNTQPLLKEVHAQKGTKFNFLDYQLQFIETYQILREMKKDLTKIFIDEIYSPPPREIYRTKKIVYNLIDEIWSIDLADMIDYKLSINKGLRYIFIIIDNYNKYLWAIPPKNESSQTITNEFSNILSTSKRKPFKIESDRGTDVYISIFQNFLKL